MWRWICPSEVCRMDPRMDTLYKGVNDTRLRSVWGNAAMFIGLHWRFAWWDTWYEIGTPGRIPHNAGVGADEIQSATKKVHSCSQEDRKSYREVFPEMWRWICPETSMAKWSNFTSMRKYWDLQTRLQNDYTPTETRYVSAKMACWSRITASSEHILDTLANWGVDKSLILRPNKVSTIFYRKRFQSKVKQFIVRCSRCLHFFADHAL